MAPQCSNPFTASVLCRPHLALCLALLSWWEPPLPTATAKLVPQVALLRRSDASPTHAGAIHQPKVLGPLPHFKCSTAEGMCLNC